MSEFGRRFGGVIVLYQPFEFSLVAIVDRCSYQTYFFSVLIFFNASAAAV